MSTDSILKSLGLIGLRLDHTFQPVEFDNSVKTISLLDSIAQHNSTVDSQGRLLQRALWLGNPTLPEPTISLRDFIDAFLRAIAAVFQARGFDNIAERLRTDMHIERMLGDIAARIQKFDSDAKIQKDALYRYLAIMPQAQSVILDTPSFTDANFEAGAPPSIQDLVSKIGSVLQSNSGLGSTDALIGDLYKKLITDSLYAIDQQPGESGAKGVGLIESLKSTIALSTGNITDSSQNLPSSLTNGGDLEKNIYNMLSGLEGKWADVTNTIIGSSNAWANSTSSGYQNFNIAAIINNLALTRKDAQGNVISIQGSQPGELAAAEATRWLTVLGNLTKDATNIYKTIANQADGANNSSSTFDQLKNAFQDATAYNKIPDNAQASYWDQQATSSLQVGSYYYNSADQLFYQAKQTIAGVLDISNVSNYSQTQSYTKGNVIKSGSEYYQAIKNNINIALSDTSAWQKVSLIAENFNSDKSYQVFDNVYYNGILYQAASEAIPKGTIPDITKGWIQIKFNNANYFSLEPDTTFQLGLLVKSISASAAGLSNIFSNFSGTFSTAENYSNSQQYVYSSGNYYQIVDGVTIQQKGNFDPNTKYTSGDVFKIGNQLFITKPNVIAPNYVQPETYLDKKNYTTDQIVLSGGVYWQRTSQSFKNGDPETPAENNYWNTVSELTWANTQNALEQYSGPLSNYFTLDTPLTALITQQQNQYNTLVSQYKSSISNIPSKIDAIIGSLNGSITQIQGMNDELTSGLNSMNISIKNITTSSQLSSVYRSLIQTMLEPRQALLLSGGTISYKPPGTDLSKLQDWITALKAVGSKADNSPLTAIAKQFTAVLETLASFSVNPVNGNIQKPEAQVANLSTQTSELIGLLTSNNATTISGLEALQDRINAMFTGAVFNPLGTTQVAALNNLQTFKEQWTLFSGLRAEQLNLQEQKNILDSIPQTQFDALLSKYNLAGYTRTQLKPDVSGSDPNQDKRRTIINSFLTDRAANRTKTSLATDFFSLKTKFEDISGSLSYRFSLDGERIPYVMTVKQSNDVVAALGSIFDDGLLKPLGPPSSNSSPALYYQYALRQYQKNPSEANLNALNAALEAAQSGPQVGSSGKKGLLAQLQDQFKLLQTQTFMPSDDSRNVCQANSNNLNYLNWDEMNSMKANYTKIRDEIVRIMNSIDTALTRQTTATGVGTNASDRVISASELATINALSSSVSTGNHHVAGGSYIDPTFQTDLTVREGDSQASRSSGYTNPGNDQDPKVLAKTDNSVVDLFDQIRNSSGEVQYMSSTSTAAMSLLKIVANFQNFFFNPEQLQARVASDTVGGTGTLQNFASWGRLDGRFQPQYYELYMAKGRYEDQFANADFAGSNLPAAQQLHMMDTAFSDAKNYLKSITDKAENWKPDFNLYQVAVETEARRWVTRAFATTSPGEDIFYQAFEAEGISPEERRLASKIMNMLLTLLVAMLSSNLKVRNAVMDLAAGKITLNQLSTSITIPTAIANNMIQRAAAMAADMLDREKANKRNSADFVATNPVSSQSLYDLASFYQMSKADSKEDVEKQKLSAAKI